MKEELSEEEFEPLKGLLWTFRSNWADLDEAERAKLDPLFERSPDLKLAHGLREVLREIFETAPDKAEATELLGGWSDIVVQTGLRCFDTFLNTLKSRMDEITNYFVARQSSGFVEGLNNKLKVLKRRCFGILDPERLFQQIHLDLEGFRLFRPRPNHNILCFPREIR